MPGRIIVNTARLDAIRPIIREKAKELVLETAETVANVASGFAPVDTGSLQAGFYIVGLGVDTYADAVSQSENLNPKAVILDRVDDPPTETITAYVSNVVEHLLFTEFGTIRQAAQPCLTPAAEGQEGGFVESFRDFVDNG